MKEEKDNLNTWYYINATSVKRDKNGALCCKINRRNLIPVIKKYFKNIKI